MVIQTFVFLDLETTGLPGQEKNRTKVTELTLLAVFRPDIEKANILNLPPINKLSLLFNPQRNIQSEAVKITGLSNEFLSNQVIFKHKIKCINDFLDLPKPVCLVAHNGDRFDFKILNTEYADAQASLPDGIMCVDSLKAFKAILKNGNCCPPTTLSPQNNRQDIFWADLDITPEDWIEIDQLSESFSNLTSTPKKKSAGTNVHSYSLSCLYRNLVKKEPINSHRAEGDCMMLLECVIAMKQQFLNWADENYKYVIEIQSLTRQ